LQAGVLRYRGTIEVPGQSIPATVETMVTEADGLWEVREETRLPVGTVVETTKLEKSSLVVRARQVSQGPLTVDVAFRAGKADGSVQLNGTPRPLAADLGGELLADGAGRYLVIGRLPLAVGYTATLRNFNVQNGRPTLVQLRVVGMEEAQVASGTFNTYRVELTDEGGTQTVVWVDATTRLPVRLSVKGASLGGAAISLELVESRF
jgi:hypothetical protein